MEHSKLQEMTWTQNLKRELVEYYDDAYEEHLDDGCSVNVKNSLFLKWDEAGYGHYGLTAQDLLDQSFKVKFDDIVTNVDKEFPLKIEGLRKVLENVEKGNDVPISDVVSFIREIDDKVRDRRRDRKELENEVRMALHLKPGVQTLNMMQTMEVISAQLPVDSEQELISAFQIFDEEDSGFISLPDLENLMTSHGVPLNEEDLNAMKKTTGMIESTQKGDKSTAECPRIDYRAFVKHFLQKISVHEDSLRGYNACE